MKVQGFWIFLLFFDVHRSFFCRTVVHSVDLRTTVGVGIESVINKLNSLKYLIDNCWNWSWRYICSIVDLVFRTRSLKTWHRLQSKHASVVWTDLLRKPRVCVMFFLCWTSNRILIFVTITFWVYLVFHLCFRFHWHSLHPWFPEDTPSKKAEISILWHSWVKSLKRLCSEVTRQWQK